MAYEWLFQDQSQLPADIYSLIPGQQPAAPAQPQMGQMLDSGLDPALMPGPPRDQAEYANRASGWSALATRFQTDPAYQMALLRFGTSLMQPVPRGQSAAGHVGTAVAGGAETLVGMTEQARKAKLEERRLGFEERRVAEGEKTGDVNRRALEQRIDQNTRTFPMLIKKLDAEIDRLISQGEVDSAQASYLKERARLYPQEVAADLRRAKAAERTAGKPSAGETTRDIFESTVKAMAKTENVPEEEARARLGSAFLGRSGGKTAAGVQNRQDLERLWKAANPKQENETDQAYTQRSAKGVLEMETQRKRDDYLTQKLEFITKNSFNFKGPEEAEQVFDKFWKERHGELPKAKPAAEKDDSIKAAVEKAGQKYEPDKYEYRILNGKVQRRPKQAK